MAEINLKMTIASLVVNILLAGLYFWCWKRMVDELEGEVGSAVKSLLNVFVPAVIIMGGLQSINSLFGHYGYISMHSFRVDQEVMNIIWFTILIVLLIRFLKRTWNICIPKISIEYKVIYVLAIIAIIWGTGKSIFDLTILLS